MNKKIIGVVACSAVAASMAIGASASDELIKVGYAQVGHESDWRTANTQNYQDVFSEANGYELSFVDCDNDNAAQIEAVRNFINQELDYIVIAPIQSAGWDTVLQEAQDAGIPVIIADREIEASDDLYDAWVGTNTKNEGITAGNWLAEYLGDKDANILVIEGSVGASATIGRTDGFNEVAKDHENWKILEQLGGDFTQAKGRESMETLLEKYDDIDVVISENDNMTFGAVDAIQAAGRSCGPDGDIVMVSFDAVRSALEAMQKGEINVDFECNPLQGPLLAETIRKLENGEEVEKIQYVDETYFDTTMDLETLIKDRVY